MQILKKLKLLLPVLVTLNFFFTTCLCQNAFARYCGKIQIQRPFLNPNSTVASPLSQLILCKSHNLYFRTSLGLFPVSSVDYTSKTLTISHPHSCSSLRHFVSPSLLSAGFPALPHPNSLLLFNCSNHINYPLSSTSITNCTRLNSCASYSKTDQKQELKVSDSCLLVNDLEKLEKGFYPKDLNCSHYSPVYKSSLTDEDDYRGYELGTRISFDIPDHVPDICTECEKPNGNCGVGLKCICHPQECKDKVISIAGSVKPFCNILLSLLSLILALAS